ncbi:unnamed protein product, partial [marine sediment metagenome]
GLAKLAASMNVTVVIGDRFSISDANTIDFSSDVSVYGVSVFGVSRFSVAVSETFREPLKTTVYGKSAYIIIDQTANDKNFQLISLFLEAMKDTSQFT